MTINPIVHPILRRGEAVPRPFGWDAYCGGGAMRSAGRSATGPYENMLCRGLMVTINPIVHPILRRGEAVPRPFGWDAYCGGGAMRSTGRSSTGPYEYAVPGGHGLIDNSSCPSPSFVGARRCLARLKIGQLAPKRFDTCDNMQVRLIDKFSLRLNERSR